MIRKNAARAFLLEQLLLEKIFKGRIRYEEMLFIQVLLNQNEMKPNETKGRIFSHERPFYEHAVSDLNPQRYLYRPVKVAHSSFIEGSHTIKNTASR